MSVKSDALRARLAEIDSEFRAIHTEAADAALNEDQQTRWDSLDTESVEIRQELDTELEREARAKRTAESRAKWQTVQVGGAVSSADVTDVRSLRGGELRDLAMKKLEVRGSGLRSHQIDQVESLLNRHDDNIDGDRVARALLASETDAYRRAFMKGIAGVTSFTAEEANAIDQMRAASIGTDAAGGYGVPVLIDPTIMLTSQESLNPIRGIATVKRINTDVWKGVTSAGVSWSYDSEAAEVSDDTPTLAQPSITTYMARGFIPYSIEVSQDYPAFASEFGRLLAEGYDELQAETFVTGSTPVGIVTALDANTWVEVTPTTDGTFTATDIDKVWTALPDRAKNNATWLMSTDVASYIALWGDAYGGRTVDLAGVPTTLRTRPVVPSPYMPSFSGTTGAANILVVGDFSRYYIIDRVGMSVESVPHIFGANHRPTGQRGIFAHARNGADSIDDTRFRLLQNQ